jgi:MFS family permease
MDDAHKRLLHRNVRLYPVYAAAYNAFFWMPVFFLYFSEHLTLDRVLLLESIYYIAVVVLEVPSGYFSDSIGRRPTLLISAGALLGAYGLFFWGASFLVFAAAQLCLAVGISFNSGTDTSLHYDSLAAVNRESEYAHREAVAARLGFHAGAVAALLGGLAASIELRYAYGLSALAAGASLVVVILFTEPGTHEAPADPHRGIVRQLGACLGHLRQPALRWLFAFSVLMVVLNHIPYEFYQPYLDLLSADAWLPDRGTPVMAGVLAAATMFISGSVAGRSIAMRDRIGTGPTLLLAAGLQTVIIASMAVVLHPIVVGLILLRSVPRGLMSAPLNAAIAPRVTQGTRATYLSMQSLVGRLAFSATLAGLALLVGRESGVEWPPLSRVLTAGCIIALVGTGVLALFAGTIRRADRTADPTRSAE